MEGLALVLALIAFFFAIRARRSIGALQARLAGVADELRTLQAQIGLSQTAAAGGPAAKPVRSPTEPSAQPAEGGRASPLGRASGRRPTVSAAATLEERLGTRWAVWVGGLALALGGLLLVRYSIEQGIFGPGVRVALGAALLARPHRRRRMVPPHRARLPVEAIPAAHVPSILTAAGTVSAFGTVYAAHALYSFIGPAAAFVLLGIIGVATMLAAALHGPALAGLGLAGSLVVPMLVVSQAPNPWPLVIYLAVVAAAAYALARLRRWLWLARPRLQACSSGVSRWWAGRQRRGRRLGVGSVRSCRPAAGAGRRVHGARAASRHARSGRDARLDRDGRRWRPCRCWRSLALGAGRFDAQWTIFAAVAMAILALTAWRSAPAAAAAALAGIVALGAIATWPGLTAPPEPRLLAPAMAEVLRLPDNVSTLHGFRRHLHARHRPAWRRCACGAGAALPVTTAGLYALAAIVPPLLALILAYLRVTQFDRSIPFALFAVVLAADFYLAAYRFGSVPEAARTPATAARHRRLRRRRCRRHHAGVRHGARSRLSHRRLRASPRSPRPIVAERDRIPLLRAVVVAHRVHRARRLVWDPRIMGADVGTLPDLQLAAARLRRARRRLPRRGPHAQDASAKTSPRACAMRSACCSRRCWCSSRSATRSTAAIRWPTPRATSSRGCSR